MATIHLHETTTSTPEQFVAGLTDFGPGRSELFGNSSDDYLKVHDQGPTEADVTEGSGGVWERLHYDWSDPDRVVMTTTDSNIWGGHSGHTYTFTRQSRRDDRGRCRRGTRRQEPQGTGARDRARDLRQARLGEAAGKDRQGHRGPERRGAGMSTARTTYDGPALAGAAVERDASELLGQVMGLVAVTVGFTALGAYLGRDLSGATGLVLFIGAFACIFGLNFAAARGREQLAIGLLFGLGLLLGLAVAPVIADYANADPSALWQAAGTTAAFVAACGAYGYATRRDLSSWGRTLFWALLGLIAFGIVAIFVLDPGQPHHLRRPRARDLRRVHDLRLQPAARERVTTAPF